MKRKLVRLIFAIQFSNIHQVKALAPILARRLFALALFVSLSYCAIMYACLQYKHVVATNFMTAVRHMMQKKKSVPAIFGSIASEVGLRSLATVHFMKMCIVYNVRST